MGFDDISGIKNLEGLTIFFSRKKLISNNMESISIYYLKKYDTSINVVKSFLNDHLFIMTHQ
jgi:hypothetical protein